MPTAKNNKAKANRPKSYIPSTETRTALLDAGTELFGLHGYRDISTRTLSRDAGVNISSIRYHFGGKEAFYQAVLENMVREIGDLIGPLISKMRAGVRSANGDTAVVSICAAEFVESWCRAVLLDARTQKRMPCIIGEMVRPSVHFDTVYNGFFKVLYEAIGEVIGAARQLDPQSFECKVMAHAVVNQLLGFVIGEAVFWRQTGLKTYTAGSVTRLLPNLKEVFLLSIGLPTKNLSKPDRIRMRNWR